MKIDGGKIEQQSRFKRFANGAMAAGKIALDGLAAAYVVAEARPRQNIRLEDFLKKQSNPYVANILVGIYNKEVYNRNGRIHVEHAIDIVNDHGLEGVIDLLGMINAADVWSGGTAKGFYSVGSYRALHELGVHTKIHAGSSAGALPAAERGLSPSHNVVSSPSQFEEFCRSLADALGSVTGTRNFVRLIVREGLVREEKLEERLKKRYNGLKVGNLDGTYIIATNFDDDSDNKVVYSASSNPNEPVWSAVRKSSSHLFLFDPLREGGTAYMDGILEVFPLRTAFETAGAQLAIGVLVNYHISKQHSNFSGPLGILREADRGFKLMQGEIIRLTMKWINGQTPEEVAEFGDYTGRVILDCPNLSSVDSMDFAREGPRLVPRGRDGTLDTVARFLKPEFKHKKYDANYFIERARYGTKAFPQLQPNRVQA